MEAHVHGWNRGPHLVLGPRSARNDRGALRSFRSKSRHLSNRSVRRRRLPCTRGSLTMRIIPITLIAASLSFAQGSLPLTMKRAVEIALAPEGSPRVALA